MHNHQKTMDDDDVLAGVPDDAEIQEESALLDSMDAEAQDEAKEDRAAEVAEVGRFSGKKKDRKKGKKREGGEEDMEEEEAGGTPSSLPKKVGKRKIIQHSWPAEGPLALVPFGIDPDSAEEKVGQPRPHQALQPKPSPNPQPFPHFHLYPSPSPTPSPQPYPGQARSEGGQVRWRGGGGAAAFGGGPREARGANPNPNPDPNL